MRIEAVKYHGEDPGGPVIVAPDDESPGSILPDYWTAIDALDEDRVACHFDPSATFQLGQQPPLRGRKRIRRAFVHLFTEAEFLQHDAVTLWYQHGLTVADADVRIILGNGSTVMVPITTILRQRHGKILACRVYLPPEPSLAQAVREFRARQEPCRLVSKPSIPANDESVVNSC